MADVTVALTAQSRDTRSADLVGAGAAVTAGQTFEISTNSASGRDILVFLEETNTGAATVTFDAGDNPPAIRSGLGTLAISLAQADLRLVVLEAGRFYQSTGNITGTVATNTVKIYAVRLPRNY